ncbi:MAG: WD40 repeat domain-containing protein [Planctomycetaceae bacterium]
MSNRFKQFFALASSACVLAMQLSLGRADDGGAGDGRADREPAIEAMEFETTASRALNGSTDVLCLAESPSGSDLIAAFHDGCVILFDRTTRQRVAGTKCHDAPVSDMAVAGNVLAAAVDDGTVRTWSLPDLTPINVLPGHAGRAVGVAVSADGHTIASCGIDGTVRLWHADPAAEIAVLTGHNAAVRAVAFSADGRLLASAGDDGTVRLWRAETRQQISSLDGHAGRIRDVAFSPDGRLLASAGEDGTVRLWNADAPETPPRSLKHDAMVWRLCFASHGRLLASGDADGTIRLWNVETGALTATLHDHTDTITSLLFAADSKSLFSSSHDGTINTWHAMKPLQPPLAVIDIDAGKVWASAVSPTDGHVAAGGRDGFVRIVDLRSGQTSLDLNEPNGTTIDCLEYSLDGRMIAAAGWKSSEVVVWNVADGSLMRTFVADANVRAIAFSPDGTILAAGCDDNQLLVWDVASGDLKQKVNAHAQPVYDISFSPDGRVIATCCGNWREQKPGEVKLWKTSSLIEIAQLAAHEAAVRAAVFSPDGSRLASVSEDGVIIISDVKTQQELPVMKGPAGSRTLDWSPDGRLLAAGQHNGTTTVWDLKTASVIRRLGGNDDTFSVRFVPDGSVLCSAGGDRKLTLWDTSDLSDDGTRPRTVDAVRNWRTLVP